MAKLNVAVLMGGRSSEREVSLKSGKNVSRSLDAAAYNAIPVEITEDGRWIGWNSTLELQLAVRLEPAKFRVGGEKVDVVFVALHGRLGEDGTVQGLLEMMGVPHTGSGVLASALAMNKLFSKKIFLQEKIPTNKFVELDAASWLNDGAQALSTITTGLGRPVVVKPACEGSSVGINIAESDAEITDALNVAFSYGESILVERYLKAREIQCGIVGNKKPYALPLIEIVPKKEFFDFEAKYTPELAEEIVPALISDEDTKNIQDISLRAYQAFGCRGFARVDTFLLEDGQIFVSEINTIPGLTASSLFPKEAEAAGIRFPDLLSTLIDLALEKE